MFRPHFLFALLLGLTCVLHAQTPQVPVTRDPVFEREKPLAPSEDNPEPVEPYQPALPLRSRPPLPPKTSRVQLIVEGAQAFSEAEIRGALADSLEGLEQSGLSPALADDTAFFLGLFYRKQGFTQANVQWRIVNRSTLRLTVAEGPRAYLGEVRFEGVTRMPPATLLDYLTGPSRERFPGRRERLPFSEGDVQSGVDRLRGLYESEGFLDAVIEPPQITLSRDQTRADVTVSIHAGIQYRFGKISFEGDIIFYPQTPLLKEMEVFTSRPYTPLALTNLERKIVYFYRARGYFNAEVRAESDPGTAVNGVVPVTFFVNAGEIYHFGDVTVTGLKRLRAGVFAKRFRSLKNRVYHPEEVERRYRQLMSMGLFSQLKLTQTALPDRTVGLNFDVEEAKARELGFGLGYTRLEGMIVGARVTDRNLLGFGRPLSLAGEIAQRSRRGEVNYTNPWLFDSDYTLRLRLYALTQHLSGYNKTEEGFRPEIARKITPSTEVSTFALLRNIHIDNQDIVPVSELGPVNYHTASIGLGLSYDTRNSVLNPRRGFLFNTTGDFGSSWFGSSVEFARATVRWAWYQPVGNDSMLAIGARAGTIVPLGGKDSMPIDERFFNGGSNSVRSFRDRTLGPKDARGHPVGGETFTCANVELVTPLRDSLDIAFFSDVGTTGRRKESGLGHTGVALGAGLRYRLPIGPIRLDYGWNPARQKGQAFGALHFTFGFAF